MVRINESKTNYIICEDFDGERRMCYPYAYSFTNLDNATATLIKAKEHYKRNCEDDKTWIDAHKVSEPYLVVVTFEERR